MSQEDFIDFSIQFGRYYIAAGGPTSRLEESLTSMARDLGYEVETWATPTGLFVSCRNRKGGTVQTDLARIKEGAMNLSRLCWLETLGHDVQIGKISPRAAMKILKSSKFQTPVYTVLQNFIAAFVMGAAISFPTFRRIDAAIVSGLITIGTYIISGPMLRLQIPSPIFREFLGCFFTLFAAVFFSRIVGGPLESFSIGGIILLVPGLTLTTAISELADQNFISGTAKLMKGMLTLLALGIAYILFQDISPQMPMKEFPQFHHAALHPLVSAFGVLLSVSGFAVLFQVPRKSLPWSSITGVIGWLVLMQFDGARYSAMASFLASIAVGLFSLALGRRFHVPSQTFSVPGILALLPGMLALSSFRSFAAGHENSGIETAFKVTLVASSIVFGLFCSRVPFALTTNMILRKKCPTKGNTSLHS